MPLLIVLVAALLFAPWLIFVMAGAWIAYSLLVAIAVVGVGLTIAGYMGYRFFVVHPRQERFAKELQQARKARMQASDEKIAAERAASDARRAEIDEAKRQKKAAEDAIQAEVDEQIREAKIRKEIKARSAK